MGKRPDVSGRELIRALQKDGFRIVRQKGSHVLLEKVTPERKYITVVPLHSSIKKGTLVNILRQSGLTRERLAELL